MWTIVTAFVWCQTKCSLTGKNTVCPKYCKTLCSFPCFATNRNRSVARGIPDRIRHQKFKWARGPRTKKGTCAMRKRLFFRGPSWA